MYFTDDQPFHIEFVNSWKMEFNQSKCHVWCAMVASTITSYNAYSYYGYPIIS